MQSPEIPFFARFLEPQEVETETQQLEVRTDVKAGGRNVTLKYPSDGDDYPAS